MKDILHILRSKLIVTTKPMSILVIILVTAALNYANAQPGIVSVNPPQGGFQIEGNLQANIPTANIGDWAPGAGGTGGSVLSNVGTPIIAGTTYHLYDLYNNASDDKFADNYNVSSNPNSWTWNFGSGKSG